ncbi:hypothetical protein QNI19_27920 [Cytophagaceae bacterium DM2B3-1]|uniref:Uncharacterized protein n=2 Tax=Xanthocytophaga TaxID=3078918 RepID=A0AAE3QSV4_9BACT|nr:MULTISPECIES: hypothetical protein [Xanthocytophaga]MDJ1471327.1 hypothetical protein [Xanthocytophaga flavus]MDJ1484807.1 hypothetical protein [Xanthocytophaga flavus]MDJ1496794.1 hypothetical protein [Xanthocytophaga flavus]MDJ1503757.1 hypothetical protein [Xanthocytophaga agilis]
MAAIIIILSILTVGVYIINVSLLSHKDNYNQSDFKTYWNGMREKQGRYTTATRRR